jgi:hypothetical protein
MHADNTDEDNFRACSLCSIVEKEGQQAYHSISLTKGGAETFQDPALHIQQVAGFVRQRPRYDWRSAFLVPAVESVGHAISRRRWSGFMHEGVSVVRAK